MVFNSLVTHRAINILGSKKAEAFALESHPAAFKMQLKDGFGIEFDIQPLKDTGFVVTHDADLKKLTNNNNSSYFLEVNNNDFRSLYNVNDRFFMLEDLLNCIELHSKKNCFLHLKSHCQEKYLLDRLVTLLTNTKKNILDKLVIFDLKPSSASYIKSFLPHLNLAASISHPHDIERFGQYTGNTLISISDLMSFDNLYDWVWMDEWDKKDKNLNTKTFISDSNISLLKKKKFNIAVVSPELHEIGPGLHSNDVHEDAKKISLLIDRWSKLAQLDIDAICTDYATKISSI